MPRSARRPVLPPAAEPAPRPLEPRTWEGVLYRPSRAGAGDVRHLFDFAGAWAPPPGPQEFGWEAAVEERFVGGALVERHGEHGFIHGPVVVAPPAGAEPLEVAAQLIHPLLRQAVDLGIDTLFTRPQGIDRLWVRFGFIPVPEASLPPALRGRPGTGLHAWRRPGSYTIAVPDVDRAARRARGR